MTLFYHVLKCEICNLHNKALAFPEKSEYISVISEKSTLNTNKLALLISKSIDSVIQSIQK
jgi:hypothetical protein